MSKATTHAPAACDRQKGIHLQYSGKCYSDSFLCPTCGTSRRYNLNFLGTAIPVCNGQKIVAVKVEGCNLAERRAAAIAKAEGR